MGPCRVVVAWSGGKDSALALERLLADPAYDPVSLVTTVTSEYDRVSMHGVRRELVRRQADVLGLPLLEMELGSAATNESYERALGAALNRARERWPGAEAVAYGDLFLEDVRAWREALLARLGWRPVFPIWGAPTGALAEDCIARGYQAILTCVDTTQLDGAFAGRAFDRRMLTDLPAGVDPCGERGEFHTFVHAAPMFREPVPVRTGERVLRSGRFEYCDLLPAD